MKQLEMWNLAIKQSRAHQYNQTYELRTVGELLVAEKPKGVLVIDGISGAGRAASRNFKGAIDRIVETCSDNEISSVVLEEAGFLKLTDEYSGKISLENTKSFVEGALKEKTNLALYLMGCDCCVYNDTDAPLTYFALRKIFGKDKVFMGIAPTCTGSYETEEEGLKAYTKNILEPFFEFMHYSHNLMEELKNQIVIPKKGLFSV